MNCHFFLLLFSLLLVSVLSSKEVKCKCGDNGEEGKGGNKTCSIDGDTPRLIASGREKALTKYPSERTLIIVKPDGVLRGLIGETIIRFERRGYKLLAMKFVIPSPNIIEKHYEAHLLQPYMQQLAAHFQTSPVLVSVWEGWDVIRQARKFIGETSPNDAAAGTLRGDYGIDIIQNVVHASSSVEEAIKEIKIWFTEDEITTWKNNRYPWDFVQQQQDAL